MERVDPQIAFAAKEEILRNILKTHSVILIEGWEGTGKTATTLKAVKGLGEVYYHTGAVGKAIYQSICSFNNKITILENTGIPGDLQPGKHVIIFDDFKQLAGEERNTIRDMVKTRSQDRKIVVITQVVLDAQDILEYMDVVVRFKQNTAEMLHTKLSDQGL